MANKLPEFGIIVVGGRNRFAIAGRLHSQAEGWLLR